MIRARLLVGFILVALLPTISVGIGTYIVSYQSGRQQSIERLESVAARKELAIQVWSQSLQQELKVASQTDYSPKLIDNALVLANENESYTWYNNLVRRRLQYFVDNSTQIEEMFLIDLEGEVFVSTDPESEGQNYRNFIKDHQVFNTPFVQLPYAHDFTSKGQTDSTKQPSVFVLIPLSKSDGEFVGLIGGKVDLHELNLILTEKTGLGTTGRAYLIDPNYALLVGTEIRNEQDKPSMDINSILTAGIDAAIQKQSNQEGVYKNLSGVKVVGVYRWVSEYQFVLAIEQNFSEAFNAVSTTTLLNLIILFLSLLFATTSALYVTRNIARVKIESMGVQLTAVFDKSNLQPLNGIV